MSAVKMGKLALMNRTGKGYTPLSFYRTLDHEPEGTLRSVGVCFTGLLYIAAINSLTKKWRSHPKLKLAGSGGEGDRAAGMLAESDGPFLGPPPTWLSPR